jgi:transcription termination factor Rho
MNKNKILIELSIPLIEKNYDLYIPINKKVGTVKRLIEEGLLELTDNDYVINENSNFYSMETGDVYDVNKTVRETDLKNGSRIILI